MFRFKYTLNGQDFEAPLNDGTTFVGRSPKCDIVINEPSVSGNHLKIEVAAGSVIVTDLGSSNGTVVNRTRLDSPVELKPEYSIRLGRVVCELVSDVIVNTETPEGNAPVAAGVVSTVTPDYVEAVSLNSNDNEKNPGPDDETGEKEYLPSEAGERHVQVITGGGNSYPDADSIREKNKKIKLAIFALVALVLLALLVIPQGDKNDNNVNIEVYGKNSYLKDIDRGLESFRNRAYKNAMAIWNSANEKWLESNPEKLNYSVLSRELGRMTAPLAAAQEKENYSDVDWIDLSRQIRNLVDDMPMPENVRLFMETFRKQVLEESGNRKAFSQGVSLYEDTDYTKAIEIFESIPKSSHFYNSAKALITKSRDSDYESSVATVFNSAKKTNTNWIKLVEKAEMLLRLRENPKLSGAIIEWRQYAGQQKTFSDAERESDVSKNATSLKNALSLYGSIPENSPFYQRAQTRIADVKNRLMHINISSLYAAGDSAGLKNLAVENSDILKDSRYMRTMAKVRTILKHFDMAESLIKKEKFFQARDQWQSVVDVEPRQDNVFNVEAQAKLREWSLERLGNLFFEKGQKALKSGDYQVARKSFETAGKRCAKNVSAEVSNLKKIGYELYIKAQMEKSSGNALSARDTALKAKSCLIPGDEYYSKVESFLQNL